MELKSGDDGTDGWLRSETVVWWEVEGEGLLSGLGDGAEGGGW